MGKLLILIPMLKKLLELVKPGKGRLIRNIGGAIAGTALTPHMVNKEAVLPDLPESWLLMGQIVLGIIGGVTTILGHYRYKRDIASGKYPQLMPNGQASTHFPK